MGYSARRYARAGERIKQIAKAQCSGEEAPEKMTFPWGVQVVGDRSELKALTNYRQLQKKHEAILGAMNQFVMRTTIREAPWDLDLAFVSRLTAVHRRNGYAQGYGPLVKAA